VQRGATPKREFFPEMRMRKNLYERPADDQILFDLCILNPRNDRPPFRDVVARYHASGSTSAFT
jgi:hypothetical protein